MRLLDTRFQGLAKGVGTAKILGRVHSAQLKLADLHLNCSFTIMEGSNVDLLFGLDMLKAHQACIDLEKNCLRIRGREVSFLPEHEIPSDGTENEQLQQLLHSAAGGGGAGGGGASLSSVASSSNQPQGGQQQQSFPGAGNTLGATPAPHSQPVSQQASRFPEDHIRTLMDLGATREDAIAALNAMGGNVDLAASALFSF